MRWLINPNTGPVAVPDEEAERLLKKGWKEMPEKVPKPPEPEEPKLKPKKKGK